VFEEYRAGLTSRKLKEVDDAYRDAATLIKAGDTDFHSIIVDETQDFGPQALKLLRAMVPESPNDLFFVGDGNQRIYRRNRSSMRACGIDIRGRAKKLYLNYRTTEEIRRVAVAILEGCEADDLDDGADEVKRYKSISHGAKPVTLKEANLEGAFAKINGLMKQAVEQGRHACVIVPTRQVAGSVLTALKGAGLTAKEIRPEEGDEHDSNHIRVATMHRAKGLEFDEVILLDISGVTPGGATPDDVNRLQYVALTRAKRLATVIKVK
jgi:superfamily I DNA/RNA helicase